MSILKYAYLTGQYNWKVPLYSNHSFVKTMHCFIRITYVYFLYISS